MEIFAGSMLIVLGSAGAMVGLDGVQGARGKWIRAAIVGVTLALGSYVASEGISNREQYFSDREAFISLNVERRLNGIILGLLPIAHQNYKPADDPGFISGYMPLRFSQAYLVLNNTTVVTRDHELAKALNKYILCGEMLASSLHELEELNRGILRKTDFTKNLVKRIFGEKGTLDMFLETQEKLESLIASNYQWSNRDVWNRLDRPVFDAIKASLDGLQNLIQENQRKAEPEKPLEGAESDESRSSVNH
jgi:hypothetical protein